MEKKKSTIAAADTPETLPAVSDALPAEIPESRTVSDIPGTDRPDGFYCYIGPGITGLIQHGAIFRGTRKEALSAADEAIRRNPLIETLIVSGNRLPEARLKVKKPGNALYMNYQRVAGKA